MAGDPSAFAALGLDPDADAASVERAYKRLIKEHHPDRAGGNAERAAELNRAYRELRRGPKDALDFHEHPDLPKRRVGRLVAAGVGAGLVAGVILAGSMGSFVGGLPFATGPQSPRSNGSAGSSNDAMDQPLDLAGIDGSTRQALRLSRSGDEMALAEVSRGCHRRLRAEPSVSWLDRCAAFDDAVAQLQDRDPLRDQGPFSELAVTGRQWSAASALSNDYLAIDSRLDEIRLRVELALAVLRPPPTEA